MSERPNYIPAHRPPVWLSSEDVKAAIVRVAKATNTDAAKAVCWDLNAEINALATQETAK